MDPLILLLIFLFSIIIHTAMDKNTQHNMVVGTVSLIFLIIWMSGNNINICKTKIEGFTVPKLFKSGLLNKKKSTAKKPEPKVSNTKSPKNHKDIVNKKISDALKKNKPVSNKTVKPKSGKPVKEKVVAKKLLPYSKRPKPLEYSENNYKYNLFDELGSLADNKGAHRMKYLSNQNKVAMDNMARQDKYTNINYFAQELDEAENSRWWDDENLENEF
mgnify:FL=1